MPALVDDREKSAVVRRLLNGLLHIVQIEVRARNAEKRSVLTVNGHRAGDAQIPGAVVELHVGKDELARIHGLTVPVPIRRVVSDIGPVLVDPVARDHIGHQRRALREGEEEVVRAERGTKGNHHIRHVGDQSQPVRDRRFLEALREKDLHEHLPVVRGVRPVPLRARNHIRMAQQLPRVFARHLHPDREIPEHLVDSLGLLNGEPVHVLHNDCIDHSRRGPGHGGDLPIVGLLGQIREHPALRQHGREEHPRDDEYGNQNQRQDLALDPADDQSSELFQFCHLCSRRETTFCQSALPVFRYHPSQYVYFTMLFPRLQEGED